MILDKVTFGDVKVSNLEESKITVDSREIFKTEAIIIKIKSKIKNADEFNVI